MSVCYIIAAGECNGINIDKMNGDLVIAADAGLRHCINYGITPDITVGDFDSMGTVPDNDNIIKLPVEKDDTDTAFAVKYAMEKGYKKFVIFGGTGGKRPDHTFANIALVAYVSKNGGEAFLNYGEYTVTAVTDAEISFPEYLSGDISVFAFDTAAYGVTETGLFYNFDNEVVENTVATGVSNSFTGKKSTVRVNKGTLIIYFEGNFSDCTIDKL